MAVGALVDLLDDAEEVLGDLLVDELLRELFERFGRRSDLAALRRLRRSDAPHRRLAGQPVAEGLLQVVVDGRHVRGHHRVEELLARRIVRHVLDHVPVHFHGRSFVLWNNNVEH